jgi:hypothetical protein
MTADQQIPPSSPGTRRRRRGLLPTAGGLCLALLSTFAFVGASQAATRGAGGESRTYHQVAVIPVSTPAHVLYGDIVSADHATGQVYFSDGANSTLDVFSIRRNRLVAKVPIAGGPAGVTTDRYGRVWTGSGSGSVKVLSPHAPFRQIASIAVGAPTADELAYDPKHSIIAVTSPDATTGGSPTPWVTLIDARPGHYRVLAHVVIPGAPADSIEQPQWNPGTSTFVEAVRSTKDFPNGEVAVIDPAARRLQSVLPIDDACTPGGLAVAPGNRALLGCNVGAPVLMSLTNGRILHTYTGKHASGADEVSYNAQDGRFYVAEAGAVGPPPAPQLNTPTVMVIDARSGRFITNIALGATAPGFHQVAAEGYPGHVFVPQSDGMHVYAATAHRKPGSR